MKLRPGRTRLLAAGLLATLALVLGPRGEAQLSWGTRRIEIQASLQDTNAAAVFTFTNTTSRAISIHEVKASCGACTIAELSKKRYLPGEVGSIKVIYTFGSRVGQQDSMVLVRTDDLVESAVVLNLRVHISEILQIRPAFVVWRVGDKPSPKEVSLKVVHEAPVHLLGAKTVGDGFRVDLRSVDEGRAYVVTIAPKDTKVSAAAQIVLETDLASQARKEFRIHAMVREGWPPSPVHSP